MDPFMSAEHKPHRAARQHVCQGAGTTKSRHWLIQRRNDGSGLLTSKVVAGAGAAANAPESGLVGDSWSSSSSELAIGFMTRDMLLPAHRAPSPAAPVAP